MKASPWDNGSKGPRTQRSRPRPDSNRGPFDPKSDAVTDWPLRLRFRRATSESKSTLIMTASPGDISVDLQGSLTAQKEHTCFCRSTIPDRHIAQHFWCCSLSKCCRSVHFHRHSRWLYSQQQSSSSSSNRFIEHDVSTRKLGPSSGIRPSFLNKEEGPSFRVETSCSIKRLLEDEELCCRSVHVFQMQWNESEHVVLPIIIIWHNVRWISGALNEHYLKF